ncbi:transglutaminase domain-containing protein [Frondihabitans sp. PAMC 28766]|uniref:transglutaminase domain-containing protein n=1 Tax=Frondihabitans sp. PAMC 28766 TaxID=1795630 RepID=UPI0012FF8856|nr:transglutaminase domain-containing protein [Frondihabitans sp. PAMC 28766]
MSLGFALLQCLGFAVIMAVAAITLWPVYRSTDFVVLVTVSLVVGSAIALVGTFLRLSSFWILLVTIVAFGVFGVAVAVPSQTQFGVLPTLDGLRELASGVALGWKQLITITLPVGGYQALLVPAFVLLLPGTVIGVTTALRSRRPELALVPPIVVFLGGIVLGSAEALLPLATGLGLLVVSVLWVVWWRLRRRRLAIARLTRATRRQITARGGTPPVRSGNGAVARRAIGGTVVTLVVAGAVAAGATTVLSPSHARWVARDAIAKPFDPRAYVSPLSGFRAYEQTPAVDADQLSVTGLSAGDFVRIATLDTYDGVDFSVGGSRTSGDSGTFTRVPTSFDQSKVVGRQTSIGVTVDSYSGVWLPTVGKLESIDFSGRDSANLRDAFFYNDTTGTAAVVGGIPGGVSYSLDAVVPAQPSTSELDSLTPGPASVPTPTNVPVALKTTLGDYVNGVSGQGARLLAAINGLKKNGYVSHGVGENEPVSRSGHGADRLTQLFTDPLMIGDAEQYSAAAALMADQLGFPARVVLGFSAGTEATGAAQKFTGSDITAVIEVDTAQFGWVTLDPNPTPRKIPDVKKTDPNQISRPQSVVQPPPQEADPPNNQTQPQSKQDSPALPPAWIAVVLAIVRIGAWVLLVAGLIMAPFIAIVGVKARRRLRRRRSRDAGRRITGGWQEFHDAVVDHGISPGPSATRAEVAAAVGGSRPAVLARVVDRSVFAPESVDPADADRVWNAVGEMRAHLDAGLTRWQRFRARVSTKSLRGYHGPKASKR